MKYLKHVLLKIEVLFTSYIAIGAYKEVTNNVPQQY